ncbi:transposase [Hymenobacter sp. BT770]|uniref:transposase n=1 Tax=Hymenobacter sp. BT770 TaxID=2886942 RepID=UPI001D10B00C|nr:transposase [Hymenobacter sp. BT770]MCC3152166.1 transposase [Hymenobacter sp. BT770]MDO3413980.1 transposase [Hymenobacter sp. BT770]
MELPPQRRSIRYHGYDYSMAGYYAVTICCRDKAHLLGVLVPEASFQPSALGQLVLDELLALPNHYPTVRVDTWVLMPNHLHFILVLTQNQTLAVSQVVGGFKSRCYGRWRSQLLAAGYQAPPSCWQRNYYERIIRDTAELEGQRRYILDNPNRW